MIGGCPQTMKFWWRTKQWSKGCRFITCKTSPRCKGFKWIDDRKKAQSEEGTSSKNEGKLKLTIPWENPILVEGNVNDISEIMKKLRAT